MMTIELELPDGMIATYSGSDAERLLAALVQVAIDGARAARTPDALIGRELAAAGIALIAGVPVDTARPLIDQMMERIHTMVAELSSHEPGHA